MHTHACMSAHIELCRLQIWSVFVKQELAQILRWDGHSVSAASILGQTHKSSEWPTVRSDPLNPAEQCITAHMFMCASKNQRFEMCKVTQTLLKLWWMSMVTTDIHCIDKKNTEMLLKCSTVNDHRILFLGELCLLQYKDLCNIYHISASNRAVCRIIISILNSVITSQT